MLKIHSKTFNPEILYVFDTVNRGPASGKKHTHDFFEMSIIMEGESYYIVEDETVHLSEQTVLLFNPGVEHKEYIEENMINTQIHIGLRNFNLDAFPKNVLPFKTKIVHLGRYKDRFFDTCWEIIKERNEAQPGYELVLKSLVYKLLVYLMRDEETVMSDTRSVSKKSQDKQELVKEIQFFIENHYPEDVTLEQLSRLFYTSPTTISRLFKEHTGDSPIHYLIYYRLSKAKELIQTYPSMSIKEIAASVGYEDSLYFSKLFKKYYGKSPTFYRNKE